MTEINIYVLSCPVHLEAWGKKGKERGIRFFVGQIPIHMQGGKTIETITYSHPTLSHFLKESPQKSQALYSALSYWALCSMGRLRYTSSAYADIKPSLSVFDVNIPIFGHDLARKVRTYLPLTKPKKLTNYKKNRKYKKK